jgi:hypothetical protein
MRACPYEPTNVPHSIRVLVERRVDVLLSSPELPLHLDAARYKHVTLGLDTLTPTSRPND